jgi:hypothetical protein
MKSRKSLTSVPTSTDSSATPRPRLVKASELAAREASRAEVAPQIVSRPRPVLVRAPRSEMEARDMFSDLFKAA